MKRLGILLPIAAVAALLAVAIGVQAAPSGAEVAAQAVDNAFEPKVITITAGDTIVWTNTGQRTHTVTASDGSWDSGRLTPGQTFSRQFDTPGTIPYYCIPHGTPDGQGMAGTIMVQAAGAAPAQTPSAMPSALPRTGDGASPDAWAPVGLAALALLVAGALSIGLAAGREPR